MMENANLIVGHLNICLAITFSAHSASDWRREQSSKTDKNNGTRLLADYNMRGVVGSYTLESQYICSICREQDAFRHIGLHSPDRFGVNLKNVSYDLTRHTHSEIDFVHELPMEQNKTGLGHFKIIFQIWTEVTVSGFFCHKLKCIP